MLQQKIQSIIRDVPNFPKEGVAFKDITPLLANPILCSEIIEEMKNCLKTIQIDAVVGVESRGFLFGMMLASALRVPFVPVRKKGKLPFKTIHQNYQLEYGSATLEIHLDALKKDWKVLVHDDLLATGGTAFATAQLVNQLGANVSAFAFIIELSFLNGKEKLDIFTDKVINIVQY